VQTELRPLVEALNEAFRPGAAADRDAAAVCRQCGPSNCATPLALLKTQAGVGLRETDPKAKDEALAAVDASVDGMARLSNQLLSLARAEQGSASLRKEAVDFSAIAREALESLAQMALARNIDLGLEAGAEQIWLWGTRRCCANSSSISSTCATLHSVGRPGDGKPRREGDTVVLRVEDSGPVSRRRTGNECSSGSTAASIRAAKAPDSDWPSSARSSPRMMAA